MGQTCEPFQRPEATQGVAIVGMNPQRAAQVRARSLELAALQLEVPQHRQRERDRRRRSEEHTSELQSQSNLVCRLLLEKKKTPRTRPSIRHSELTPERPLQDTHMLRC